MLLGSHEEGSAELGILVGYELVGSHVEGANVGLELDATELEGTLLEGIELGFSVGDAVGKEDDG